MERLSPCPVRPTNKVFFGATQLTETACCDAHVCVTKAGEYIDMTLGVTMGLSTMAAAALGNTISDVAGVGLGGAIESMARKMGLPPVTLSA